MLGHDILGSGEIKLLVLHDWLGDTSTWDGARAYCDPQRFTWAFADLRGYGRSMAQPGEFSLEEAARDVLALADALHWPRFTIVGHSMSALVAYHLAQQRPDRVARAIVLTPAPPRGLALDDAAFETMQAEARADTATRLRRLRFLWGTRLSERFIAFKEARWRETADLDAVASYLAMFGRRGLPDLTTRIRVPVCAITGEQDTPAMRSESVRELLAPLCEKLEIASIASSGHYPMQETPPLLVTLVEGFAASGDHHALAVAYG